MILNGSNISHAKINRKKSKIARGQHKTKRIKNSSRAMIAFIYLGFFQLAAIIAPDS
jgi:hypothetical protein